MGEAGLAHDPAAHHAAGDADINRFGLQLLLVTAAILIMQHRCQYVPLKMIRVGTPLLTQVFQLCTPLGDDFVFVVGGHSLLGARCSVLGARCSVNQNDCIAGWSLVKASFTSP